MTEEKDYNADFSNAKVGDQIWTIQNGWEKIKDVRKQQLYCIYSDNNFAFTIEGKHYENDKFPSAFIKPPNGFGADSPPCEFKKDDPVLVRDEEDRHWVRRYFNKITTGQHKYNCFVDGKTEWSSNGKTTDWRYCKSIEGEE